MWDLGLAEKTIVITGGNSGIGFGVAKELALQGARVGLVARDTVKLENSVVSLPGEGHRAFSWDLSDTDSIPQLGVELTGELGPVDGVVHSAGRYDASPLQAVNSDDLRSLLSLNFMAPLLLTKVLVRNAAFNPGCSVVFVSSVSSKRGQAGATAYASSKGALDSLMKSMVAELTPKGIRFNSVLAGIVETDLSARLRDKIGSSHWEALRSQHPLGFGEPEQVSNAIAFLLSKKSSWITGAELAVDGGYLAC